jgi:predicted outer membrane repeat protein
MNARRLLILAGWSALFAAFGAIPRSASAFAIYTVGGDGACGYSDIQDALDAAADNPGEDYVWIAMNASYTGQQLLVHDQDVDIEGGFTDCSDFDIDTAQTTVSGAGNGGWAVFSIDGTSHVFISNLFITGANRDDGAEGGGIWYGGNGALTLQTTTIGANRAGYGGGISVTPSGGPVEVHLLHDSLILNNTAHVSGGGIRIEGDTRLYAVAPNTTFTLNTAETAYGGGLEVLGPARADLGSAGYTLFSLFDSNDAEDGGAIAAIGGSNGAAFVRVFTTDPQTATTLDNNIARGRGGAIYTNSGGGFQGVGCLYDFNLSNNVGEDGAAIYTDEGSGFYMNSATTFDPDCGDEPVASLGAVACAAGPSCNAISGSLTQHGDGTPSAGAVVKIGQTSQLLANRFRMADNLGAWMIRIDDGFGVSEISNCLVADNNVSNTLISGFSASAMSIASCTFADNGIDLGYVIDNDCCLTLDDSIFDQPDRQVVDFTGDASLLLVNDVLANDVSTLGGSATSIQGTPTFVDAANRDYHLTLTSLGIDYAPAAADYDLDGHTRNVDLPGLPNTYGPLDLGAFERAASCGAADTIYCDGFDGS